ncbi:MAG: S24/S26 family peptidase [Cyanobacteria bacterium P01_D01_bin.56]
MYANENQTISQAGWSEYIFWLLGQRQRFIVRENSMVPTLMPGDTVLAEIGKTVHVGDIAIVRWKNPSDETSATSVSASEFLLIKRVNHIFDDGALYLISDNLVDFSVRDSRHFGSLSVDKIVGRVTSRLAAAT